MTLVCNDGAGAALLHKFDIVNALGRKYGLRRYIELCTPTSGAEFARIDQWRICFEWPADARGPTNVEIVDYH